MRRVFLVPALLLPTLLAAACGSSDDDSGGSASTGGSAGASAGSAGKGASGSSTAGKAGASGSGTAGTGTAGTGTAGTGTAGKGTAGTGTAGTGTAGTGTAGTGTAGTGTAGTGTAGTGTAGTGTAGTGTAGTGTAGTGTMGKGGLFEKPHAWNTDVSGLAPSSRSDAIINALISLGGWGNGNKLQTDYSLIVLRANASTPRATVNGPLSGQYCYSNGPDCDPIPYKMPIPTNGNTEGSNDYACDVANEDCHVLVVEEDEKKLYELYNATGNGTTFNALGAFTWDLTKQYTEVLRGDQCTSADAAGLPMAALLPTADEVAAGVIPHAIRFALPNPRMKAGVYVRPATHAGSPSSSNLDAPPYGVRFRLKASFDETPYNPAARVVLKALKTYGMILSDGGNIALMFSDDRLSTAKWANLGITPQTFNSIGVSNFEVVGLGDEITLTYDCVPAP